MTKEQQYYEYLTWGGTMTMQEWEMDGRFDKNQVGTIKISVRHNIIPVRKYFTEEERKQARELSEKLSSKPGYKLRQLRLLEMDLDLYNLEYNRKSTIEGLPEEIQRLEILVQSELNNQSLDPHIRESFSQTDNYQV